VFLEEGDDTGDKSGISDEDTSGSGRSANDGTTERRVCIVRTRSGGGRRSAGGGATAWRLAGGTSGGRRGSGARTGNLVSDGGVEGTGHTAQRKLGRKGEIGVCGRGWVGQGDGGEADKVLVAVLADGGVYSKGDGPDFGDVDRLWVGNRLEERLLLSASSVKSNCAVSLLSKGRSLAVIVPGDSARLATGASSSGHWSSHRELCESGGS